MGLFSKLKNVLFEEEEVEIPVIKKEEKVQPPKREEESIKVEKKEPPKKEIEPAIEKEIEEKIEAIEDLELEPTIDREIFKVDPTFEFPVFDEEDFSDTLRNKKSPQNVLNQKEDKPKKVDFGKYEIKEEPKVEEDNKKFKPTPIISPVYGVLDQNYKKEDIVHKPVESKSNRKKVDIDAVRKKAFGTLEDDIENLLPESEHVEEVASKTIDELLMDTIDEELEVSEEKVVEEVEEPEANINKTLSVLDELESDLEKSKKESKMSDTLENDLFNLIDSMYDNGKDE